MALDQLVKNIYYVGARHPERKMFDELIPLPDGTSYNSYLVKGSEKTALIDTVDPEKEKELLDHLRELRVERIDYIIVHHCEQDHSGSIMTILDFFQDAKVVTNQKCKDLLKDHLAISDNRIITIKDRETLSLGDKTLEFVFTPWVHWPETMCTYLKEDNILFSCDFFGAHLAMGDIWAKNDEVLYKAAKRYYAEIMMPFRVTIKNNLEKIKNLGVKIIAPSHGPIYNEPEFIIEAYKDWALGPIKNEVVIPYVSMHGSTLKMVEYLTIALEKKGLVVKPFDLAKLDLGELAMALVDCSTVVVGSPTVLVGPHPLALYVTYLFNVLRPKTKYLSVIGSYGWGGKMVDQLKALLTSYRGEVLDPVIIKGCPKVADFALLDKLVASIVEKHQQDITI